MKSMHQSLAHLGIFAGRHQGGGPAGRHLLGKAGAAQRTCQQLRRHLRAYFVAQQTKTACVRAAGLKALA